MKKTIWGTLSFCLLFALCCTFVFVYFPADSSVESVPLRSSVEIVVEDRVKSVEEFIPENELTISFDYDDYKTDTGLLMYRQSQSRAAVEWFYTQVTNNRDVALSILDCADKYDIPLALAFSLAHTESNYNPVASHKNSNGTIDRGLFQLNNNTFPNLTEADFYDPRISSYYGMSHLRFCLNTAGNEIAALAMYNAGATKVRNGNTPQRTLNYISQIESYKDNLEQSFAIDVLAFYEALGDETNFLAKK